MGSEVERFFTGTRFGGWLWMVKDEPMESQYYIPNGGGSAAYTGKSSYCWFEWLVTEKRDA